MRFTDEVIIAGDSAGGAVCTTLARNSLTKPELKIDKQILIYPSVDYTLSAHSVEENGSGFLLEKNKVVWYFNEYFRNADTLEIRKGASPLLGQFSSNLPKTLIISAGCDPLRDEAFEYAKKLENVQVNVQHLHFDTMINAFMLLHDLVEEECTSAYSHIRDFIES